MDFHGVNLGRYAHFRRNLRMFLNIFELQIQNKKNALGKTVLKLWPQICRKMASFVHKTTLKKKCAFEKCAVCSVLPATGEEFAIEIRFFKYFTLKKVLGPNKYKPIMYLKFGHHAFWFLETFVKK